MYPLDAFKERVLRVYGNKIPAGCSLIHLIEVGPRVARDSVQYPAARIARPVLVVFTFSLSIPNSNVVDPASPTTATTAPKSARTMPVQIKAVYVMETLFLAIRLSFVPRHVLWRHRSRSPRGASHISSHPRL